MVVVVNVCLSLTRKKKQELADRLKNISDRQGKFLYKSGTRSCFQTLGVITSACGSKLRYKFLKCFKMLFVSPSLWGSSILSVVNFQ